MSVEQQEGYEAAPSEIDNSRSRDAAAPRRGVASEHLLNGARELVILHDGCEYVLRLTRQNKLILTK